MMVAQKVIREVFRCRTDLPCPLEISIQGAVLCPEAERRDKLKERMATWTRESFLSVQAR